MFAVCNKPKLLSGSTRESEFFTHATCGHIALRLGAFTAKSLGSSSHVSRSAAVDQSLAARSVYQHSYIIDWHASVPASHRVPHRLVMDAAAPPAHQSPSRSPVGSAAPSAPAEHLGQSSRPYGGLGRHDILKPGQRWLAGSWSLWAEGRHFARKLGRHSQSSHSRQRGIHSGCAMEATCAALQMIQTQQQGMPLVLCLSQ